MQKARLQLQQEFKSCSCHHFRRWDFLSSLKLSRSEAGPAGEAGLPSAASGWAQLHSPLQDHRLKATSPTPRHLTGATICYEMLPFESHGLRARLWDSAIQPASP